MELAACKLQVCYKHMPNSYVVLQIFLNFHILKYLCTSNHLPIFSNNIFDISGPSTSVPNRKKKKRYSICLEYNIKEGASWPEAAPLLFRLLCCWQECIFFGKKKKRNDNKKTEKKKKKSPF